MFYIPLPYEYTSESNRSLLREAYMAAFDWEPRAVRARLDESWKGRS